MVHLGSAAAELLTDTNKLVMLVVGGSALALGVYGAREGTRVAGKAVERWLGTPKLVRGGWVGGRGRGEGVLCMWECRQQR
jgi:ATPase family AAA domain-containing protein 3A/B